MALCLNCGIELDDKYQVCPLCGKEPGSVDEQNNIIRNSPSEIINLQRRENRRYLWELSGILSFSGIAVCTIVDLLMNKGLKWSLYTDVAITASWIILTLLLFAFRKPVIFTVLMLLDLLASLFLFDLIADGRSWFFAIGLPVTTAAFISVIIIAILYKTSHFKGLNIIAAGLLIIAGFCIVTEMILDNWLKGAVDLKWSLISGVSILPAALIFLFYHYRLKKGNMLDGFFHI